jgi:hypothetical protein
MKDLKSSCWRSTWNRHGSIVLGRWWREAIGGGPIMRVSRTRAEAARRPVAASIALVESHADDRPSQPRLQTAEYLAALTASAALNEITRTTFAFPASAVADQFDHVIGFFPFLRLRLGHNLPNGAHRALKLPAGKPDHRLR